MKCYMCALDGKDSDAVAICVVCGMGLCMDHVIREEIESGREVSPFPVRNWRKHCLKYCANGVMRLTKAVSVI